MNDQVSTGGSPQAATPCRDPYCPIHQVVVGTHEAPTRWGTDMTVEHRITGSRGVVNGVDFEEDLVFVQCGEHELTWRIENVFEVSP